MSHFTRIRTKMADKTYLLKALDDLGYPYEDGDKAVKGYGGRTVQAEIRLHTKNPGYDIGFYRSGDNYEVVADWYGVREFNQRDFLEKVNQRYAYHATCAKLEEQGFTLVEEENQKDGRIHLLVRRMA